MATSTKGTGGNKMGKLVEKRVNVDGDVYRLYQIGKSYKSVQDSYGFEDEVSHISIQAALNSSARKMFRDEWCESVERTF